MTTISSLPVHPDLSLFDQATSPDHVDPVTVAGLALVFAESLDLAEVLDCIAQQVAHLFGGVCRVRFAPMRRPAEKRRVVAGPNPALRSRDGSGVDETYAAMLSRLSEAGAAEAGGAAAAPSMASSSANAPDNGAALLFAPLIARGQRIGSLDLVMPAAHDFDVVYNQRLLRALAGHAALAIDTADRFAQVQIPAHGAATAPVDSDPSPMLALIAHDLRSPLTALNASVQTLVRLTTGARSVDQAQIVRLAHTAEAAVAQLTAQIDALTPDSASKLVASTPPAQEVDLVKLTRLMANFYQQTTGRHKFTISTTETELLAPIARAHAERVFSNLLVNGIKYSPLGGEIAITLSREDEAFGQWASLSVRNSGIGVPPQDLPSLGQIGYRAQNVGPIPGTGFGLASVREVVEQYGGTFAIQSVLGETTTVRIRLPLTISPPHEARLPASRAAL